MAIKTRLFKMNLERKVSEDASIWLEAENESDAYSKTLSLIKGSKVKFFSSEDREHIHYSINHAEFDSIGNIGSHVKITYTERVK